MHHLRLLLLLNWDLRMLVEDDLGTTQVVEHAVTVMRRWSAAQGTSCFERSSCHSKIATSHTTVNRAVAVWECLMTFCSTLVATMDLYHPINYSMGHIMISMLGWIVVTALG